MTPDETSPAAIDEHLLAQMLACDSLLHVSSTELDRDPAGSASTTEANDRARTRLLLLLRMLDAAEVPEVRPADADSGPGRIDPSEGRPLLGRFEILDDLGSGGFGFVVRARDLLLGRIVALKMPLPERVLSSDDVRRSLREARAAARLDHPNIVRIHDAGELGPLGYFIAAEFCDGPSLPRWLKSRNEPVPARLAAFWIAALADAVQHAHDRGILHRDIKPDNVILAVTRELDEFTPRLTDFGLAKLAEEASDDTRTEARIGTPCYMAPEQAAGRHRDIGPLTDVYALGTTLYEIVAGRPPFRGETDAETLRLVIEAEPVAPRSLRPALPRDLETICLKCLSKEPARRYVSAGALRDDLQRFLDGRPIKGRPVSAWEHIRRWARRRPGIAVLSGLVVLLACGLVGGIVWWASWLEWHNRQLKIHIARADQQAREAQEQTRIAEERRHQADRHHYAESLRRVRRALDAGQLELGQDILHDIHPSADGYDPRGFAWRYLWRQANREFTQLWGHEATVLGAAVSRDGTTLATWDLQNRALLWDLSPGIELDKPRAIPSTPATDWGFLAFSPDGRYLAAPERDTPNPGIRLFEVATTRLLTRLSLKAGESLKTLFFDSRSRRLACALNLRGGGRSLAVWEMTAGPELQPVRTTADDHPFVDGFTGGDTLLALQEGERVTLRDPWTGKAKVRLAGSLPGPILRSSFSEDGRFFAAHVPGNRIVVWDTGSGGEAARFEAVGDFVLFAFSPKGSRVALMENSGRVTILDRATKEKRVLTQRSHGRKTKFQHMAFSPDESLLAIELTSAPGGVQPVEVWDIATALRLRVFPGRKDGGQLAFLPRGRALVIAGGTAPRIWRLDPPAAPDALAGHTAEAWAAAFSPDGKVLATGSDDTGEGRTIKLWNTASGQVLAGWKGHTATVAALTFSPDGRVLASASLDSGKPGHSNVNLWDVTSHRRLATLEGHTGPVRSVAFSPVGRWLATAGDDGTARLWDVAGKTMRAVLAGHTKNLTRIAFSPDGSTLATASNDATIRLWDVATGQSQATLRDVGNVNAVAFAPDGSLLASTNEDGSIKLWNSSDGYLVRTIRGEADQLRCLAFTPDGRNVVAAGKGKVIRIWDIATGQELLTLEGHKAQINALAFSPQGSILASCSHDGAVKLWRAEPIEPLPAW